MRDSDLEEHTEHPSEEEVLAPKIVDSIGGRTPEPVRRTIRRRGDWNSSASLIVGTALAVVVVGSAAVFAVGLLLSVLLR